jgi:hypothetical protein
MTQEKRDEVLGISKWERDGRFGLSMNEGCFAAIDLDGGSLGTGHSMSMTYFGSAEAREYYIQVQDANRRASEARVAEEMLKRELAKIRTLRGAWRNLKRALRESMK